MNKAIQNKITRYATKHMHMFRYIGSESFDTQAQVADLAAQFDLSGADQIAATLEIVKRVQGAWCAEQAAKRAASAPKVCFMCHRRPVVVVAEDMCQECWDKVQAEWAAELARLQASADEPQIGCETFAEICPEIAEDLAAEAAEESVIDAPAIHRAVVALMSHKTGITNVPQAIGAYVAAQIGPVETPDDQARFMALYAQSKAAYEQGGDMIRAERVAECDEPSETPAAILLAAHRAYRAANAAWRMALHAERVAVAAYIVQFTEPNRAACERAHQTVQDAFLVRLATDERRYRTRRAMRAIRTAQTAGPMAVQCAWDLWVASEAVYCDGLLSRRAKDAIDRLEAANRAAAAVECATESEPTTPEPQTDPRTMIARAALPILRAALPMETLSKRTSKAHKPNAAYTLLHAATVPRVAAECRYRPGLIYVLSPFDCALDTEDFTIIGYNKALILALLPANRPAADVCFLTDDSQAELYRGDVFVFAAGDPSDLVCSGSVAAHLLACGLVPSYAPMAAAPVPDLDRDSIARQAFYGGLPALADYLMEEHGYSDLDGHHRANCADLSEYLAWVAAMPVEVLAVFVAPDPELAGLVASGAAHQATATAGQAWLNHRYGTDAPTYAAALYHAQELETLIHRAYIAVCLPL